MFLTRFFHAFCYAVGAEKALIQAALRVRFSRGKGFIPFPSKMAFYCVTPFPAPIENRGAVATQSAAAPRHFLLYKTSISAM